MSLNLRNITDAERLALRKAALEAGKTLSEFCREILLSSIQKKKPDSPPKVVNIPSEVVKALPAIPVSKGEVCSECGSVGGMHQKSCAKGKK